MAKFLNLLKLRSFANAGDSALEVAVNADDQPRLRVDAGGKLNWGNGSSVTDTNLYRSAADTLRTDDSFVASGGLTIKSYEVDTNGASNNSVLAFNGTKFAPANISGGALVSNFPHLLPQKDRFGLIFTQVKPLCTTILTGLRSLTIR